MVYGHFINVSTKLYCGCDADLREEFKRTGGPHGADNDLEAKKLSVIDTVKALSLDKLKSELGKRISNIKERKSYFPNGTDIDDALNISLLNLGLAVKAELELGTSDVDILDIVATAASKYRGNTFWIVATLVEELAK